MLHIYTCRLTSWDTSTCLNKLEPNCNPDLHSSAFWDGSVRAPLEPPERAAQLLTKIAIKNPIPCSYYSKDFALARSASPALNKYSSYKDLLFMYLGRNTFTDF